MDPSGHGTDAEHRLDAPVGHAGHGRSDRAKQLGLSMAEGGLRLDGHGGSELRFTATHDGRPVEVEPYLGARGHLVALRWGDLAFLHVHPIADEDLAFEVTYPGPGTYRLFLHYSVDGVVRTAAFTTVAT